MISGRSEGVKDEISSQAQTQEYITHRYYISLIENENFNPSIQSLDEIINTYPGSSPRGIVINILVTKLFTTKNIEALLYVIDNSTNILGIITGIINGYLKTFLHDDIDSSYRALLYLTINHLKVPQEDLMKYIFKQQMIFGGHIAKSVLGL